MRYVAQRHLRRHSRPKPKSTFSKRPALSQWCFLCISDSGVEIGGFIFEMRNDSGFLNTVPIEEMPSLYHASQVRLAAIHKDYLSEDSFKGINKLRARLERVNDNALPDTGLRAYMQGIYTLMQYRV